MSFNFEKHCESYHLTSDEPIFIVNFPLYDINDKIVIDGNHRFTAKLKSKNIKYILFNFADTLDFIPQAFEYYLYLYMHELQIIKNFFDDGLLKKYIDYESISSKYLELMKKYH